MPVSHQIRTFRHRRGWTQQELGRRCELKQQQIARVERGGNARLGTLRKIARALNATLIITPL